VLTLVNTAATPLAVEIGLYADNGTLQGSPQTVELPAHGKAVRDVATIFALTAAATGYLVLDTREATGLVGSITFGEAANGDFASCLPLQAQGHSDYLLGHVANGELAGINFYTGVAVLNTGATDREVQITAFDQNGVPQQSTTLTVSARQRQVFTLDGLWPSLGSLFGGYLRVDGPDNARLVVFELFGDGALHFLSAVPAVPLTP